MRLTFAMAVKLEIDGIVAAEILMQPQVKVQIEDNGEVVILKNIQLKALKMFEGDTEKKLEEEVLLILVNSVLKKGND